MKRILALLLSMALLLIPMSAFAEAQVISAAVDYVYDKVTITGEFEEADDAEGKIATLVVLNPGADIANFAQDGTINWADQSVVTDGKAAFEIDLSETADGTGYKFYISAPDVEKSFTGTFDYSTAEMEAALIAKLNDSSLKAAGISEFIRVYAKERITELDATLVGEYTSLKSPDKVDTVMVGKRSFADLADFVSKLRTAVNTQKNAENTPSTGGSSGGFSGAAAGSLVAPQVDENPFLDISSTYWGKDAILNLYNKGIVKGQGNGYFRPDNTITRAEFVQMVVMAFDFIMQGNPAEFSDVADSDWFASAVKIAYGNGVVKGTTATTFAPTNNITRQDMMTILYNAAKAKGINLTSGTAAFTDADSISSYAQEAVSAMVGSGVVSGYTDGSVKPLNNASRAEAAAMLSRLLEAR